MGPEQAPPPIVAVHPDGSRPPLVFFHTWFHEADHLQALGQELGDDQPLYAVDHPPPDGPLPEDLAAWVRYHRRGLDRIPVCSPYQLAGFSFGGVIALEIAMQLQAEGATVAWLGLVDTLRPKRNPKGLRPYLRYHLRELVDEPTRAARQAHLRRMVLGGGRRSLLRMRHQMLRPLRAAGLFPASRDQTLADARGLVPLKKAVWRGYLSHEVAYYDSPVALFTAAENLREAGGDPSLRWSKYLRGGLEVISLPGVHREILAPPNVAIAAHEIRASLDRAAARARPGEPHP